MDKPKGQPHEWPQGYQQSQQQPVIQQQPAGKLHLSNTVILRTFRLI